MKKSQNYLIYKFLDKINKMKEYLKKYEIIKESELFSEFDSLTLKNVLVLYKYLFIAYKKIYGEFFKLEMEQIDENLYQNFIGDLQKEENKNKKLNGYQNKSYYAFNLQQNLNDAKDKKEKKNKKHHKNKFKWNQKIIPGLNDFEQKKQKTKKSKEEEMKKNFDKFIKECKKEDEKLEKEKEKNKEKENKDEHEHEHEPIKKNNNKSKLAMLIGSNEKNTKNNNNKKKVQTKGGFKLSAFNLDEDFPPLK